MKAGLVGILVCWWLIVGWRMGWAQLLTGKVALPDFDIYYQTAKDVLAGQHPLLLPYMQTGGPPSVILAYVPLTVVPLALARSILGIGSLAAIWLAAGIMARKYFKERAGVATGLIASLWLGAFPTRFNLGQGQPNLIIMALVAVVLVSQNPLAMAAIGLIKANFLVAFAGLDKFKLLLSSLGLALMIVVGFLVIKPAYYVDFGNQRAGTMINQGANIADVDYYNQSLKSTLARFGWSRAYPVIFWTAALVALGYLVKSKDIGAGIILSLLLSPLLWQHYVVAVYPVAIRLLKNRPKLAVIAMGLLMVELPWLHGQPLGFLNSILASHYFFGLCLLLGGSVWPRREKLAFP